MTYQEKNKTFKCFSNSEYAGLKLYACDLISVCDNTSLGKQTLLNMKCVNLIKKQY